MRTYLPFLFLLVTYPALLACDEEDASDDQVGDGDGDGDTRLTEIPEVVSRDAPECTAFDPKSALSLGSDYFSVCDNGLTLGDSAYVYTADTDGLYTFRLFGDLDARVFLELRKGDCVTTPEGAGGAAPASEALCGHSVPTEGGETLMEASVYLLKDEAVTVISEGDAYYWYDTNVGIRQAYPNLGVARACEGAEKSDTEKIRELSGPVPLEEEFFSRAGAGAFLGLSCSEGNFGEPEQKYLAQFAVDWKAPEDGTFLIRVEEDGRDPTPTPYSQAITLAALLNNCGGEEAACSRSELSASEELKTEVEVTATKDQVITLVVELQDKQYEDVKVLVQVEKL